MSDKLNGRIAGAFKWFDTAKGYGFIRRDDGSGKDAFVHVTDLRHAKIDPDLVRKGDRVTFELKPDKGGKLKAVELRAERA